jgi:tetratricopeptide (TPR) repeat protein
MLRVVAFHPVASSIGIASSQSLLAMTRFVRVVAAIITVFFCTSLFAQQSIVATATEFITHNQFEQANRYLDSILKQNPKTVDALMMKGNVLLNQAWNNESKSHFNTEKAESVFDTSAIDANYFIPIIPIDTSVKIDKLWNECLQLDPSRTDIKKGLCSLYSLSLRTVELERLLIQMQPIITQSEDNAYLFAEYARNLKNRGRFEDGMTVYSLIAGMFPDLAGIRCDMANEYFYAGQLNKALAYLDSTLSKKEIDQTSYINAAALYSTLGYYDQAYEVFRKYSEKDTLIEADFYKGLLMFSKMDTGFYNQLRQFLDHAGEHSYYDEIQLARKLLPFGRFHFTLDDYMALATNEKISRYYRVLILQRGVRQFKHDCEPQFLLGSFYCSIKNYPAAMQLLESVISKKMEGCEFTGVAEDERCALLYSYALYQTGEKEKAAVYFEHLFNAKNDFTQQTAKYFVAKADWEGGKKEEAKKLFEEVSVAKVQTKYSWLSKGYLGR